MPVLAADRVRYVGEAIAIVVAETVAPGAGRGRSGGRSSSISFPPPPTWSARWRRTRRRSGRRRQATSRSTGRTAMPRGGRCGLRPRGACRARAADRYAPRAERDGAARRHRELRRAVAALHADRADPGRRRRAQAAGRRRVQHPGEPDPDRHPRRGRRLRHEGADLLRICRPDVRGAPGRAAGEMVRDAGWRAFSPTRTAATACSRASLRSMPTAGFSACACAPASGSAPTRRPSPPSSRPRTPRTACRASMSFRRSTSA